MLIATSDILLAPLEWPNKNRQMAAPNQAHKPISAQVKLGKPSQIFLKHVQSVEVGLGSPIHNVRSLLFDRAAFKDPKSTITELVQQHRYVGFTYSKGNIHYNPHVSLSFPEPRATIADENGMIFGIWNSQQLTYQVPWLKYINKAEQHKEGPFIPTPKVEEQEEKTQSPPEQSVNNEVVERD